MEVFESADEIANVLQSQDNASLYVNEPNPAEEIFLSGTE